MVRKLAALFAVGTCLIVAGCSSDGGGNQEGQTVKASDINKSAGNMMQKDGKKGPGVPADHSGGPGGGPGQGGPGR